VCRLFRKSVAIGMQRKVFRDAEAALKNALGVFEAAPLVLIDVATDQGVRARLHLRPCHDDEIVDGRVTARGPGLGLEWNDAAVSRYVA
jgi:hypothetical protein